jgi:multidrug efflux pump subunit AcrA (membrane-fusion protein)
MPVEAILNAYPDLRIPAEVIAIIPTADRAKATVQVRIALTQKDSRIVPDMGVKVRFLDAFPAGDSAQHLQGVRVPARAIIKRDGVEVAFVVDDNGTVQQRTLELGVSVGDGRQVLDGVIVGDRVIIDPVPQLQGGAQVRIAGLDGAQ